MSTTAKENNYQSSATIKKLNQKYGADRKVNEQIIAKETKPWQKALSIILDLFFGLLVVFSGLFCFNVLNNRAQHTPVAFCGCSALRIVSGSMMPDYNIGDAIMVRAVNTHTLRVGDNIAFFVYNKTPYEYDSKSLKVVDNDNAKLQYLFEPQQLLGLQNSHILEAANSGATLVFHQVYAIEEDQDGTFWFTTKGTNNSSVDTWRINERYVLGALVDNPAARVFAKLLSSASSSMVFLVVLIIPVFILAFLIVRASVKDVQIAKLELDCIEEKRKITDPICVKNKVGLNMSKKDKYKILATAPDDQKMEYVKLLWTEDKIPNCVRKYYLKRGALLGPLQKLRDINRECENMYHKGISLEKIALYYDKERAKIDNELALRYKRILKMR